MALSYRTYSASQPRQPVRPLVTGMGSVRVTLGLSLIAIPWSSNGEYSIVVVLLFLLGLVGALDVILLCLFVPPPPFVRLGTRCRSAAHTGRAGHGAQKISRSNFYAFVCCVVEVSFSAAWGVENCSLTRSRFIDPP